MATRIVIQTLARRALGAPLWFHSLVLLAALSGWAALLGAGGLYSVDEGIAAVQAEVLAETGEWTVEHPLARFDDGQSFPLRSAERTEDGIVPYGKHPLYPTILAGAHRALGTAGMMGTSIVGTVVAAAAAALIARRLDPGLAVPCFYATGLLSPLLFDSTLLIAHTVGAAAVGSAGVALVRHHDSDRGLLSGWLLVAVPALVAAVMLRSEGLLLLGSLGVVALVGLIRTRRGAWLSTGAAAVVAAAAALLLERVWRGAILGDVVGLPYTSPVADGDRSSLLSDRLRAFVTTSVKVSYTDTTAQLLLLGACALLLVVVVAIRRQEDDDRIVIAGCGLAGLLAVLWAGWAPRSAVPGLLVAFPLLWFGLGIGGWSRRGPSRALLATSALFALAVAATQYRQGGGLEWGARYVAISLPLVVPVAVAGYARGLDPLGRRARRGVNAGIVALSAALFLMGGLTQQGVNEFNRDIQERVSAVAPPSSFGPSDRDGRPVVVSGEFILPQTIWPVYDEARWIRLRDDATPPLLAPDARIIAMLDAGLDRFTFITTDLERDRPLLGDDVSIGPDQGFGPWSFVVVEAR